MLRADLDKLSMQDDEGPIGQDSRKGETDRASRMALFLGASFNVAGKAANGKIRNISPTGALLETSERLVVGHTVVLTFRGVDGISATIRRSTAKGFGIQFEKAIDPEACCLPVSPRPAGPQDFVLNLREGYRRPIWDTNGDSFRRPGTK